MIKRLRTIGIVLVVIGVVFLVAGGVAFARTQEAYGALQSFSEAENVMLSYNDDGELIDRGTTEGAQAIMSLLEDDWGYPVVEADLDPADPLVNSSSEYMYQMATITYHVLHGTQTVTLAEDVEYNGEVFAAGTYDVPVDGKYWTDFDRRHPLEGPARSQAWSGTVHGLRGELGVGVAAHTSLQIGLTLAAILAGIGLVVAFTGGGLMWASRGKDVPVIPDTVPESFKKETLADN